MRRRIVIELLVRLRLSRDKCDRTSTFERGMAAAYHLSALALWREWREEQR